jgi:MFS family permease
MPRLKAFAAYRGVLALPEVRALIGASAASQTGDWLYNAALLGYVFTTTRSAAWVAAATVCRLLPYVLLAPLGGVIADRFPRRLVLLTGDLLRLALMATIAAVVAAAGPVAVVIALAALSSAAGSAERPAALALLPRLVGEARLGPANALLHTVQDLGVVIGPGIGAILLAIAPAYVAFLANAGTFAISAFLVSRLRPHRSPASGHGDAMGHLSAGLRAARRTAFVLPLFVLVAMVEFTYGAQTVQLVIYAKLSLGLGSGGYGVLLAASGVGGLIGAVVNGQLATSRRVTLAVLSAGAVACATQLVYAGSDELAVALVVTVIGGAGLVACEVIAETVLARVIPSEILGRVAGLFHSVSVAAMVGGAVLASILIEITSLRTSLWALGVGALIVALSCGLGLRGLDAASQRRADALASRLGIIAQLPLTIGVPQLVLEQLASASELCPLPPGVAVVAQGAPAHAFYAVVDGRVVVERDGVVQAHLGPGESFGERGLLDNAPRNATVTTETDTTVLRIEGDVLLDALHAAPMLTAALDGSHPVHGVQAPSVGTALVDDPGWAQT